MKAKKIIAAVVLGIAAMSIIPHQASAEGENANIQEDINVQEDTSSMKGYTQVFGEVGEKQEGSILIKNATGANNEILLNISPETIIIDAVSGLPVAMENIALNSGIYAYIGEAMTMSLPPMTNAKVIIVNVAEDAKVPSYIKVESVNKNNDGSITVISDGGRLEATLDNSTNVFPYLTRNIVTLDDIKVGSNLVIWESTKIEDMQKTKELPIKVKVEKCLIAPEDIEDEVLAITEDKMWKEENGNWYYIENGARATGWIEDNSKWYYLNDEGIMETGWIKDNEKWYFLNANGEMAKDQYVDGYYLGHDGAWVK